MKECPKCGSVYTDITLSFCLSDGTPLVAQQDAKKTEVLPDFVVDLNTYPDVSQNTQDGTLDTDPTLAKSTDTAKTGVSPIWILTTFGLLGVLLGGTVLTWLITGGFSDANNNAEKSNSNVAALTENSNTTIFNGENTNNTIPSTSPQNAVTPTATKTPHDHYRVIGVKQGDVLYIRPGPGNLKVIIGRIPPNGTGIMVTGRGKRSGRSTWVPIKYRGKSGWVNRRYLSRIK